MITQKELSRHESDAYAVAMLGKRVDARKRELLRRLDQGEPIEGGPLGAAIAETSVRRFSLEALARIIGADEASRLRELLPPTVSRSVRIVSTIFDG